MPSPTDKDRLGDCHPAGHCKHIPLFNNDNRRFIQATEYEYLRHGGEPNNIIHRLHVCCQCGMQCTWLDLPILLQMLLDLIQAKTSAETEV